MNLTTEEMTGMRMVKKSVKIVMAVAEVLINGKQVVIELNK
ncbi:hypothetical protein ABE354_21470 [Brevibacillus laterosporus]